MLESNGTSRRSLWSGLILGFFLMVFVVTFAYVAYMFLSWGQSVAAEAPQMDPLPLPKLVRPAEGGEEAAKPAAVPLFQPARRQQQEVAPASMGRTTILLLGVDARPGQKISRTDSIMLVTLNPETGKSGMLSIPRDLKVRPSALNRDMKVTSVYPSGEASGYPGGGAALLGETIEEMLGYPIDYYVVVNFEGFKEIIDLIGGIEIDVPYEIYDDKFPDDNYGYLPPQHFMPGRQIMNGERALIYARTRHSDNDYMRASRQQQVILAVKDKATKDGQLGALLPRLPGLAIAMANTVQTDMPVDKAIALARVMDDVDLSNATRIVIDPKMGSVTQNDPKLGYTLVPDLVKVRAAADAVFADAPAGPSAEEIAQQQVQAEAARIFVLNGTQEKGLAAKTQALLVTNGFNVITVGNADRTDYDETYLVVYGDTAPATVEALVRWLDLPADRVLEEPQAEDKEIAIIVGKDQLQQTAAAQN